MRGIARATTAVLALTWALCGAAQGQSQTQPQTPAQPSVAEAARKAQADKKKQPKAAKTFTNDDVGSLTGNVNVVGILPPPPANGEPSDKTTATSEKTADKSAAPKEEAKGEAYWRKRFAEAHQKLELAQKELDVMQRELNLLQMQYYSDPAKAMSEQHDRKEINGKQDAIEKKKAEVEQLKQNVADLEEELRRSGGDPGWARP